MLRRSATPGLQGFSLNRLLDDVNRYSPLLTNAASSVGVQVPGFVTDAQDFLRRMTSRGQEPQRPQPGAQPRPPATGGIIGTRIPGDPYAIARRAVSGKAPLPAWLLPTAIAGGAVLLLLAVRR